jgi:hypothetical protein
VKPADGGGNVDLSSVLMLLIALEIFTAIGFVSIPF